MKYNEKIHSNKNRLSAGFYIVIASCLLIIGGASWFALSNYENNQSTTSIISQKAESYKDNTISYIENTASDPTESVTEPIEDVPETYENVENKVESQIYSKPEETTSSKEESTLGFSYTMPVEGKILKLPSETELQYSKTYQDMRLHKGIDIACKKGTPVNACADGTILSIDESATLGTTITIDHKAGVTVKYSAIENPKFKVGDSVKMGDVIGNSSSVPSECKDEDHIHIEILRNGKYVDLTAFGLG